MNIDNKRTTNIENQANTKCADPKSELNNFGESVVL